jgi:aspartate kinase
MGPIVCKFGGTSLSDEKQLGKVVRIVESDPLRRFVVPSAPGKRCHDDTKVTDLLYQCHGLAEGNLNFAEPMAQIRTRFEDLVSSLGVSLDISGLLDQLERDIGFGATPDYVASRGEYLTGRIMAVLLDGTFVDAADGIRFAPDGTLDPASYDLLKGLLSGPGLYVIPGFYGAEQDGQVKTFSRGGSDISGAIVARAVGASVYENWTDVSGLLRADPRIVDQPKPVAQITYREIRELSYMGASVFHDEAMFPVRQASIPIHIRNTNAPDEAGTQILPDRELTDELIVGVAGRPHFTMLHIEKALLNLERGFGRRVLDAVASHEISYENTPCGIDSMSVIIRDEELDGKGDALLRDIRRELEPDRAVLIPGLAMIATVGEGMSHRTGIAAKLFTALSDAKVNVRVIDQGASEINIMVGVEESDYERAVQAVYTAFAN